MPILTGQDDQAYHIIDDAGNPQSIAKAAIPPELHDQIQALTQQPPAPTTGFGKVLEGIGSAVTYPFTSHPGGVGTYSGNINVPGPGSASPEATPGAPSPQLASYNPPDTAGVSQSPGQSPQSTPGVPGAVGQALSGNESTGQGPVPPSDQPQKVDPSKLASFKPTQPATPGADGSMSGLLKDMDKGQQAQLQGIQEGAKAGAAKAAADSSYLTNLNTQLEKASVDNQQKEQERQQVVADQMKKYEDISADLQKQKVDPNHFWSSMGDAETGNRILAGISLFLGGISGGLNGTGQNPALNIINHAIDRDIDAQKSNIENKKGALTAQGNLISMTRARFGDERQADLAARSVALENTKLQLDQIAAKYQSPQIMANAKQLSGQLQVQIDQNKLALQQSIYQMTAMQQLSGGAGGAVNLEMLPKDARERAVPIPGMGYRVATTEEGAKDSRTVLAAHTNMSSTINEMKELGQEAGVGTMVPGGKTHAKLEELKSQIIPQLDAIAGRLKLSETAKANWEAMLPTPLDYVNGRVTAKVNALQKMTDTYRDAVLSQNIENYRPAGATFKKRN